MKICVIGGGSTYTPELLEGLIQNFEHLPLKQLMLMDISAERLRVVGGLAERMVRAAGQPFALELTPDLTKAVAGADFVITQIRVGGQQARHDDTVLALAHGVIGQETTGVVGFAKALRTIPVLLKVSHEIRAHAPGAMLINFTNPAGLVTEALVKHGGVRCIGLCNSPIGTQMALAKRYAVPAASILLDYVGINHFAWIRGVTIAGREVMDEVMADLLAKVPANIPPLEYHHDFLAALRMIPSSYLRYFYLQHETLEQLQQQTQTRAQEVMAIEATLLEKYQQPQLSEKPAELEKRGGAYYSTAAVALIRAMVTNAGERHIINVRNGSALPDLPEESVVEVPAIVDASGAKPLAMGRLEPSIRGWLQLLKSYEILAVEAAVEQSFHKALLALSCHPLVPSVNKARLLIAALNEKYRLGLH